MAIVTTENKQDAYKFFVVSFGAVTGVEYMQQIYDAYADGLNTQQIVNIFTTKKEFKAIYPDFLSDAQFANKLIENVVGTSATAEAKAQAVVDVEAALAAGWSKGDVVYQIFQNLSNKAEDDADWAGTAKLLKNKVQVAQYLTEVKGLNTTDLAALAAPLTAVTTDASSVDAIINPVATGITKSLTIGNDEFVGTSANDTFKANVVQNALGQQVNTLGSGDTLNGGAGNDTLIAKVTTGVYAGNVDNSNMSIQPETSSIENIKLEAVWNGNGAGGSVSINAKDMVDVRYIGSENSDADLQIQNMTTRRGNEQKAEGDLNGKLAETVVGMKYTNNQGTGSDFTVKFDQDYLVGSSSEIDGYFFDLLDQAAYDINSATPLAGFPLTAVNFSLTSGGEVTEYSVAVTKDEMSGINTHAQLVQLLNQKLASTYPALQNLEFKLQGQFTDQEGLRTSDRIVLVDTDGGDRTVTGGNIGLDTAQGAGNLYWEQGRVDTVTTAIPVSIKVELEKVGLAGDGGALVIGSMNDAGTNVFDAKATNTDTVSGIEEFNVTVLGNKSKSSSLAGLHSTNNNLRTVNVVSAEQDGAKAANLTIGNTNTDFDDGNQAALKDVKTFDASAFKGDLELHAALTNEVVAKYLNLKDKSPAEAAADNADFMYTGGTGNDTIDLQVSSGNLAKQGTATREDLTVNIAGGAGDDTIKLSVVNDGTATLATAGAWYQNQKLNANLSINAGDGNDTIWTPGSGDVVINAGAGNDTVYSDNSQVTKAVWVFNAVDGGVVANDVEDIQSSANTQYNLYKTNVVVNFKGFEAVAAVVDTQGKADDLAINQAIKKAINDDAVLSKLLVAEDGPANTLVITSLVDGVMDVADLEATLVAPDPAGTLPAAATPHAQMLTANDTAVLTNLYGGVGIGAVTTSVGEFNLNANDEYHQVLGTDGATAIAGLDSTAQSDNTITGGTGDDVLVLSTSATSSDTLVYTGFGNGTDSILNFVFGAVVANGNTDVIDLSSFDASQLQINNATALDVNYGVAAGLNGTYIVMLEDANNAGSYTLTQYREAGAVGDATDDVVVGVIGTLDFGATIAGSDATNFVL